MNKPRRKKREREESSCERSRSRSRTRSRSSGKRKYFRTKIGNNPVEIRSETTIYRNAVQKEGENVINMVNEQEKRNSSSSDELVNSSGDLDDLVNKTLTEKFIADCKMDQRRRSMEDYKGEHREYRNDAYEADEERRRHYSEQREMERSQREDKTEKMIREAEASKAKLYDLPGNVSFNFDIAKDYIHSAMIDEEYVYIAAHLDESVMLSPCLRFSKALRCLWQVSGWWRSK